MLSPDQLQDAGDAVAAIYSDMEARMLDHLVGAMLNGSPLTQRTTTELNLLAQSQTSALRQIVEENRTAISDAVYETAEQLLAASDKDDARRLGSAEATFPVQLAATVVGMQFVLDRDNLDMVEGAKRAFLACSVEAVTKANSGLFTADQALHAAVRKLERDGISVISYRNAATGVQTVQNKVDVAVRRHVRTQIAQDGARMTLERMEGLGVALVEVSSHEGSRPTHADWQGRVYSLRGDVEIDGVRYRDFYSVTGYGSVDGLLGANCRHSFGPYLHGAKRVYEPDPEHPSGLPNDEIYELTQKQRYMERQIRAAKRELRGAQKLYEHDPALSNKTALLKAQERLQARQEGIRSLIKEANEKCKPGTSVLHRNTSREWAGDMPAKAKVSASNRKLDAFLDARAKQLKDAGVSKARMRAELSGEMMRRGGTAKDFASLGATEQQGIFKRLLASIDAKLPSTKKANAGKHAGYQRIRGKHDAKLDAKATNPGYDQKDPSRSENCQRCVPAWDMRRRGYDVIAKPRPEGDTMDKNWWRMYDGAHFEFATEKTKVEALMAYYGDGSRAIIAVEWKDYDGGHVFAAEQVDGKTLFVDPQTGNGDYGDAFKDATRDIIVVRIDNLEPNGLMKECVEARIR